MNPIFLIGLPACGKTTLGKGLGRYTSLQFIDLDHYIEARFCSTVTEIFASKGEEGFRDIERRMLLEVADFQDVVIACGGGTPCFFDNMEVMNSKGLTVFLDASISCLVERLDHGRAKRPLLAKLTDQELEAHVVELRRRRLPYYSKAMHTFCSDHLESPAQVAAACHDFSERFNIDLI